MAKRSLIIGIYSRLINHFGYRNWWPGKTPFEIAVGAVLTQNTSWNNVERAITNLKAIGALDPGVLLNLSDSELKRTIRPAGFYNQKATRLKSLTSWWMANYDSLSLDRSEHNINQLRSELLAISGIGPETADSIILYAFGLPTFVVDAYTRRILERLGIIPVKSTYNQIKQLFEISINRDEKLYNDYHAQIVMLGKTFCRTKPQCPDCPLLNICKFGQSTLN